MKRVEDFIKDYPDFDNIPYAILYTVVWHLKINGYLKDNV
jgi:hypothetical protein